MKLYRADREQGRFGKYSCWTDDKNCAAAYMDNPGFGGPVLYSTRAEVSNELDLTSGDPFRTVAQIVAAERDEEEYDVYRDLRSYGYIYETWENMASVDRILSERYDWIIYHDDYPAGCTTYLYLGDETLEAKAFSRRYASVDTAGRFLRGPMRITIRR